MANVISWFEIPVSSMDRAIAFYNTVLGLQLQKGDINGMPYTMFSNDMSGVSGALAQGQGFEPSTSGTSVYFDGGNDLAEPLSRVEGAGGRVMVPKTPIGEGMGYFAIFTDSEGNKVGLFSMK